VQVRHIGCRTQRLRALTPMTAAAVGTSGFRSTSRPVSRRGPESASQLASATARRMTADSPARSEIRDSSTARDYRRSRSTWP